MADLTEFWIDVGGTFTDCLMRSPDGRLSTYKVLSSGITKGSVTSFPSEHQLRDTARIGDPAEFWNGYTLTLLNDSGAAAQSRPVAAFDAATGTFTLEGAREEPLTLALSPQGRGEGTRQRNPHAGTKR